jgi:hypothetical protein
VNNKFLDSFPKPSLYKELFKKYSVVRLKDECWLHLPQFLKTFYECSNIELYITDSLEEEDDEEAK